MEDWQPYYLIMVLYKKDSDGVTAQIKLSFSSKKIMMKKLFCFSFFLGMALITSSQSLSKTEQQVIKNITANMPATMQLLKESVNINSGTFNKTGVKKVGDLFARELTALGFTVQWILLPDSLKRAGHLGGSTQREKRKKAFFDRTS